MRSQFVTCIADFVSLIYPQLCAGCRRSLVSQEKVLCLDCLYDLPYSNFDKSCDNKIAQQFWGRVAIKQALAVWLFNKGSRMQHIIHGMKYKGRADSAETLGRLAGNFISKIRWFEPVDLIVPVPLTKARQRSRGYNQSEKFASGLSEVLSIPVFTDIIFRSGNAASQTRQSRYRRYENMLEQFYTKAISQPPRKHVLLVDDVVTTGATLEACANCLISAGYTVSICAAAYAE